MPKIKTNRSARKRFLTRAHDIKRKNANKSHLLTSRAKKRKRHLKKTGNVSEADLPRVQKLIPYRKIK
ncbi:MAG: 50S ribosomal protein L35 [bacterium]|nr:50S ribosomal protein L35 [bacterium]